MFVYNYKEMFNCDYVHLWHKHIQQCKHVRDLAKNIFIICGFMAQQTKKKYT
jgi:hypothetical protein